LDTGVRVQEGFAEWEMARETAERPDWREATVEGGSTEGCAE
jgi:hypothetical protein